MAHQHTAPCDIYIYSSVGGFEVEGSGGVRESSSSVAA